MQPLCDPSVQSKMQSVPTQFHLAVAVAMTITVTIGVTILALSRHLILHITSLCLHERRLQSVKMRHAILATMVPPAAWH
jgi:hypothetical protein